VKEAFRDSKRGLKCRYFLVSSGSQTREWFPPECGEPLPTDCRYWGKVFAEMDRLLPEENLQTPMHVYLTYNLRSLPEYGPHVVVLLLADEYGLIPRYVRHVRAVFKTHRIRPVLGSKTWWRPDHFHFVLWLKFARNWVLYLRSRWESSFVPREWPERLHAKIQVQDVPMGYARQELVDQKPMQDRPFHCFFAGQVELDLPNWRRPIPSPKVVARRRMLAAVRQMSRDDTRFRFDGGEVTSAGSGSPEEQRSYSQRLMDSKICLAPRGTALDTFRFFEGLRAGCLVVCEYLTDEWFYDGAPVLRVKDWSELPDVIGPYLYDEAAFERARLRSLAWWTEACGEKTVGRVMAEYLVKTGIHLEQRGVRANYSLEADRVVHRSIHAVRKQLRRYLGDPLETL